MKDKSVRMETAFRVLGCLCAALFLSVTSDAKDWRGIVPLHSTRADVENLLGEPPPPPKDGSRVYTLNKLRSVYFLDEGEVYVVYTNTEIPAAEDCLDKIPVDTVLMIQVRPKAELRLSDLPVDERRLRKFDPSEPANVGYEGYIDEEEGIVIRAFKGQVDQINYLAAKKDRHLCPTYYEDAEQFIRLRVHVNSKLDEYGDILFSAEKARLDNFAFAVQSAPKLKGHVIAYGGRRSRAGAARERAERAKNYLVNERQIDEWRIVTTDGGFRETLTVELHLAPDDFPPTPSPTVAPHEVVPVFEEQKPRRRRRRARP
ncbi:MAG TPA: hypothetical protein VER08_06050 [Pyrinomonadaceae bacterium]|nr:hypothetical protein [Pyrinomonadaceae bacterium]